MNLCVLYGYALVAIISFLSGLCAFDEDGQPYLEPYATTPTIDSSVFPVCANVSWKAGLWKSSCIPPFPLDTIIINLSRQMSTFRESGYSLHPVRLCEQHGRSVQRSKVLLSLDSIGVSPMFTEHHSL